MTQTTARIKKTGKHFEIIVDMENALKYKRGQSATVDFLEIDRIYSDYKKGFASSVSDLKAAFGTDNVYDIAGKIVKEGEILTTQEHRSAEQEQKIKQVIDFLSKTAVDPKTGRPHTPERIKIALDEAGVNVKNIPIENQIKEILEKISKVIPIKLEAKRIKIKVPAMFTGQSYGVVNPYKESENWLNNGDLEIIVSVPTGLIMGFYDKLNSITHGSAFTEELKN